MPLSATIRLGVRLSGVRTASIRVVLLRMLAAVSAAIAATLFTLVLATPHVIDGRQTREAAAIGVDGEPATWLETVSTLFLSDRSVLTIELARLTESAVAPPGLPAEPQVGHVYASPSVLSSVRLRSALERIGPVHAINERSLQDPGERIAYIIRTPGEIAQSDYARRVSRFGAPPSVLKGVGWYRTLSLLVFVGVPLATVVWTAARLRSKQRDSQLRALTMLGMRRRRVAAVAAVDSAIAAIFGCVGAAAVIVAIRPHVGRVTINGSRLASWELRLTWPLVVGCLVTVIAFATIASAATTRSLETGQGPARRRVRTRTAVIWPCAAAAAAALAVWLGMTAPPPEEGLWRRAVLQWTMPLLGFSVIAALPGVLRGAARAVGSAPLSVAGRIAQRRLSYDPEGGARPARVLAATCFCVVVTSVILTRLWVDTSWTDEFQRRDGLTLVRFTRDSRSDNPRPEVPAGSTAVPVYERPSGERIVVATCPQFEMTLGRAVQGCEDSIVRLAVANLGVIPSAGGEDADRDQVAELIDGVPTLEIPPADDNDFNGAILAAPNSDVAALLRGARPANWYVALPAQNVDAVILDQLVLLPGTRVSPSNLSLIDRAPDPGGRWVLLGAIVALILGTIGYGIAAIEVALATHARTRHLGVLGAPSRLIRATQLRELLWPLVIGCVAGSCAGLVASWAYTRIVDLGAINTRPVIIALGSALATSAALVVMAIAASGRHRFTHGLNAGDD